jgi:hypothetical protein
MYLIYLYENRIMTALELILGRGRRMMETDGEPTQGTL